MKALVLALLLSACSPGLDGAAWDHRDPRGCLEPHENGYWESDLCRPGRGFMIWVVWRV